MALRIVPKREEPVNAACPIDLLLLFVTDPPTT
jgi:hypothetical protein